MQEYIVKQGDTIQSIAVQHKLGWETMWQHSSNSALRQKRKEPNLLFPGDKVCLPERDIKHMVCATGQRHTFVAEGYNTKLRLRLLDEENHPMDDTDYLLRIDADFTEGRTDGDGNLEQSIPALTRKAYLNFPSKGLTFELQVGSLDPADEVQGIRGRLSNLGYYHGRIDNSLGPKTTTALRKFQRNHNLEATGKADEATLKKLGDVHVY